MFPPLFYFMIVHEFYYNKWGLNRNNFYLYSRITQRMFLNLFIILTLNSIQHKSLCNKIKTRVMRPDNTAFYTKRYHTLRNRSIKQFDLSKL